MSLTEAPASQADDPAAKGGLFPVDEVAAEWWVSSQELDYSYSRGGSVRSMMDPLAGQPPPLPPPPVPPRERHQ